MNKRIGTVCFITDKNKALLALIHYSSIVEKWNGIGGFVEEGETPKEAVVREISEEINLKVEVQDLIEGNIREYDNYRLIPFRVEKWKGEFEIKDPSIKELKWFELSKIPYEAMHEENKDWLPELLRIKL